MLNDKAYYCVGFIWNGSPTEDQLPRFLKQGIWENGFDNKYLSRVNDVAVGSRIAAKTTYTRKHNGESISVLDIHAIGTVTENLLNGQTLKVKWQKGFERFQIENKGAYRSAISRIHNIETIRQIFKNESDSLTFGIPFYSKLKIRQRNYVFPCFTYSLDTWDDFGYKTQYSIEYISENEEIISIGRAKFLNKEKTDGELPDVFTSLNDNYCSLGQSNSYYENLRSSLSLDIANIYLEAVNDLAINRGMVPNFESTPGYQNSVIRSSEAQKALREGAKIFKGLDNESVFRFNFSTQIGNATKKHSINFDFSEDSLLPYRIKVIIGRNGTGKTQYITRLASSLSGYQKQGEFSTPFLPPFSRVIAVSYSLFDRFARPAQTKTFSYYYCGFHSGKGFLTDNQVNTRLKSALNTLEKIDRLNLYQEFLSSILSEDLWNEMSYIVDNRKPGGVTLFDDEGSSRFSSGQIILILNLAEVLAYITEDSLLIIDEPETHLHPNSISLFINILNRILTKYSSYAIFATHSPQVLQEVPSKDIYVLDRIEDTPIVTNLPIETFGENLNTITEQVFQTISNDEYYRTFFKRKAKQKGYKTISKAFTERSLPLSLNAKIYLQSLYEEPETP